MSKKSSSTAEEGASQPVDTTSHHFSSIILGDLSQYEESCTEYSALLFKRERCCKHSVFLRVHTDYQNAVECFLEALLTLEM
jgi:hypothetical protein